MRVILVAVALSAATAPAGRQEVPEDLVIKLERTSCFGTCPVYSVTIDARGSVTYEGKRFVRVEGRQTDRIPVSRVAALLATAERIGFFKLRDRYRSIKNPDGTETRVTDLPTAFVTITRAGQSKRIEDYFGAPDGLRELERQIDDTAGTRRWIRIDGATLRQMVRNGVSPSVKDRAEFLRGALQHDDVDVVKELLEMGADPNAGYFASNTPPLMMARSAGAARALIQAGAVPYATNEYGATALGQAVHLSPDVTQVLLEAGARVDQPTDPDGRTALLLAACNGNVGVVRLLLDAGANPAVAAGGVSAIDCARQGKANRQLRRAPVFNGRPPFVEDFDTVIALLQEALAKRPQR